MQAQSWQMVLLQQSLCIPPTEDLKRGDSSHTCLCMLGMAFVFIWLFYYVSPIAEVI